jgi:hypothetical protein
VKTDIRFHRGQLLRVRPQDDDDPAAKQFAGRECEFVHYRTTALGVDYAIVRIGGGMLMAFRVNDMVAIEEKEPS